MNTDNYELLEQLLQKHKTIKNEHEIVNNSLELFQDSQLKLHPEPIGNILLEHITFNFSINGDVTVPLLEFLLSHFNKEIKVVEEKIEQLIDLN